MTGKVFPESANIYEDEARVLFDYYRRAAEKIIQEEDAIQEQIDYAQESLGQHTKQAEESEAKAQKMLIAAAIAAAAGFALGVLLHPLLIVVGVGVGGYLFYARMAAQKAQAAAEAAADAAAEAAEKQKAAGAGKAPAAEAAEKQKAAPAPEAKEAAVEEAEAVPEVSIDDFAKLQFKVGEIVACEKVKKSKKLALPNIIRRKRWSAKRSWSSPT